MRAGVWIAVVLAIGGCGYRLVDERAVFGPEVASIEIRAFENRSAEPGYEQMLADSLEEEFSRRGALRPLLGPGGADLVLSGSIREVRVRSAVFSSVEFSVEDEVRVSLRVSVGHPAEGRSLWEQPDLRVSEKFRSSPDPQVYKSNKQQALRRLSARIAERIHDGLFQRF